MILRKYLSMGKYRSVLDFYPYKTIGIFFCLRILGGREKIVNIEIILQIYVAQKTTKSTCSNIIQLNGVTESGSEWGSNIQRSLRILLSNHYYIESLRWRGTPKLEISASH